VTPYIIEVVKGALSESGFESTIKPDVEEMIKLLENWDGSFAEKSI